MDSSYIIMTPYVDGDSRIINAIRTDSYDPAIVHHKATGPHTGIIINKTVIGFSNFDMQTSSTCFECNCLITNSKTNEVYGEKRVLNFWCAKSVNKSDWFANARKFYNELFDQDLPKDYIGFIKRILVLLQEERFLPIVRVDLHLTRIDADKLDLNQFGEFTLIDIYSCATSLSEPQTSWRFCFTDRGVRQLTDKQIRETLQERLEGAFPYHLATENLINILNVSDPAKVQAQLDALVKDDVIQVVELGGKKSGQIAYRRKIHLKNQKVCELSNKQAESDLHKEKPTIAVITNLLCEKMAVDSMLADKVTYMRYAKADSRGGESHVISTKLPVVGRELGAHISSGNITTRLLGSFQSVEHVLLVGVAGAVPDIPHYERHSRLGDIVVSAGCNAHPIQGFETSDASAPDFMGECVNQPFYTLCDNVKRLEPSPRDKPASDLFLPSICDICLRLAFHLKYRTCVGFIFSLHSLNPRFHSPSPSIYREKDGFKFIEVDRVRKIKDYWDY
ncbi:hypothetical protein Ciccas_009942 [Cichlidogyrus casuarinus]|uniref:Uncharacterized protein n=1 Tax=Cichlidogyrus casuarinus TaxID=1844966 RepID=A0ABD2PVJ6_9PLAT